MSAILYRQALLETEDGGLFAISVVNDVALDKRGRLVNPQEVFVEGSTIVAVEQGVMKTGEYVELPNPQDIAQGEAKAGDNGGKPQPRPFHSAGPRFGTFRVSHTQGGVALQAIPLFGQLT
jgi:hypothetical protein